jgi:thymidylate synthase (FAD)
MSNLKGKYFRVLDKGFVGLVDWMGDDAAIEQAARVSYGAGTRKTSETRGLLRYLMSHRHSTPFEMVEVKFHIKIPMDCHRQLIRHRTANVNEYSTRYSIAIDECQTTGEDEWRLQSKSNKQGSSGFLEEYPDGWEVDPGDHERAADITATITKDGKYVDSISTNKNFWSPGVWLTEEENELHDHARRVYERRIELGVAKEQARKDLPLSNYTTLYWKCDLHNLFHFLGLRLDAHAQLEIRSYAEVMAGFVKELFPLSWEAFVDYRLESASFTKKEWKLYNSVQSMEDVAFLYETGLGLGLSKREVDDYHKKLEFLTSDTTKSYDLNWGAEIKNIEREVAA